MVYDEPEAQFSVLIEWRPQFRINEQILLLQELADSQIELVLIHLVRLQLDPMSHRVWMMLLLLQIREVHDVAIPKRGDDLERWSTAAADMILSARLTHITHLEDKLGRLPFGNLLLRTMKGAL